MKEKSILTTLAELAGIIAAVLAYFALAHQIGWWPFIAQTSPSSLLTSAASPTETRTPTLFPSSTSTRASTTTPTLTPTRTPILGIGSTKISAIDGATMVYVPAGDFTMGSDDRDSNEKPQHTVYLDAFWIDKFEVTNALYKKCVDAGKCSAPSRNDSHTRSSYYGNSQFDSYPVIYVTWEDANAYCSWARKRLPTEAEWEKAARGTDARIYPWGNAWDGTRANFCDKNCPFDWKDKDADDKYADTAPVGSYPNGTSPSDALDMAGNVWEWVADWYDGNYYSSSPRNNPKGPSSGSLRVLRGGSWANSMSRVRAASRFFYDPDGRSNILGFRCVE